ncbi:MAG TPA: MerR family DNA-binding transcriptional regulator [Pyrinomonadaceae bacterium]|nr:MerR family DNA-binding transcriptional regulator [Pyrinomonadaceae bacterium]
MPLSKTFTTKEVARLCRVSDATVKRWEDAGLLKSERTSGGHRRFRAEEIARFQREQGLGQKLALGDESVFAATIRRGENGGQSDFSFYDALLAGSEEKAADILINARLNDQPLTEIFDEMVCPPLRKIGELWFEGDLSIAQEHLATRTAYNAIYKLRSRLPVPEAVGKLAMCCTFEGEFHEMPTHLAQITIENEGWEVLNFGANTPLFSLRDEVLKHKPELVCISGTMMNNLERLAHDFREFREETERHKVSIILGGKVFEDECVRKRFPAELYAQSFSDVAEFVRKQRN